MQGSCVAAPGGQGYAPSAQAGHALLSQAVSNSSSSAAAALIMCVSISVALLSSLDGLFHNACEMTVFAAVRTSELAPVALSEALCVSATNKL